jgi:hypothetical protein
VSHSLFACDLFCTLSLGPDYISNANPACSCDLICKFQIRPIHPSRRLSIPSSYDRKNASEEDLRCIRLNYLAYGILSKSLSKEDYHAFIIRCDEPICDAHDIWTRIKIKFDESKHDSSFCASTSFGICETNPLKEEEENE